MADALVQAIPAGFMLVDTVDRGGVAVAHDAVATVEWLPAEKKTSANVSVVTLKGSGASITSTNDVGVLSQRLEAARAIVVGGGGDGSAGDISAIMDRLRNVDERDAVMWLRSVAAYRGAYSIQDGEMARRLIAVMVSRGIGV